jgi:hypothetical protein
MVGYRRGLVVGGECGRGFGVPAECAGVWKMWGVVSCGCGLWVFVVTGDVIGGVGRVGCL